MVEPLLESFLALDEREVPARFCPLILPDR